MLSNSIKECLQQSGECDMALFYWWSGNKHYTRCTMWPPFCFQIDVNVPLFLSSGGQTSHPQLHRAERVQLPGLSQENPAGESHVSSGNTPPVCVQRLCFYGGKEISRGLVSPAVSVHSKVLQILMVELFCGVIYADDNLLLNNPDMWHVIIQQ